MFSRSYIVETTSGRVRRNRHHLQVRSESTTHDSSHSDSEETPHVIQTHSRTGTQMRPPDRLTL